ncbi:metal homeostatis protein bsd2 [Dothidotthia symphoricarpi CBS 119687]|uniref:Metal homeostatis protein bsd2 n=1 Tax=Dothidotthia symphoricarpi CBS 119687 TaxID=1392245 RepID=A0A6A6AER5_9PLEO|nr:metal homeostatis protein bsd2 [Dothidotthia symphoricarpi CBS 119687]KAF2130056.1 metal homeostatis protein bsd2 [Dothidotthia symphoricarpi CBS 119687]
MPAQGYERVAAQDEDDSPVTSLSAQRWPPASPPPSFHSRASSPTNPSRPLLPDADAHDHDEDRTLADTFDSDSDDDEDDDGRDDRQRLMRGNPQPEPAAPPPGLRRTVTELPVFTAPTPATSGRVYGGGNGGVWANLSAKPTRGEDAEEKPPTYEQAAADATPPYWETTILAPGTFGDEVFVEGLPVGSLFSFIWNAMISMSFQLVGFLLTYLLHTTHAAKNGSRAGLGITLVQFGFGFRTATLNSGSGNSNDNPGQGFDGGIPSDPNAHDFDPEQVAGGQAREVTSAAGAMAGSDWVAYGLMIVGWFILIKSVSDFIRARRHEQLVLQSPDRGLGVAVVAEGESPERSV